ncbi:hypothetical protein TcCL_ESM11325, partial [Trypanosoma cruzi]
MINTSLTAACEAPGKWGHHFHPQKREGHMPLGESRRPLTLLCVLLGVSEGLIHRRLSALLAHRRCQPVSTPRRAASELVTPVSDEAARGLSGCIAVGCER